MVVIINPWLHEPTFLPTSGWNFLLFFKFGVIYIVYINAPQPYRIAARRLRDLSLMQHLVRGDCDRASYNILVDAYEDSEATFKQLKQQVMTFSMKTFLLLLLARAGLATW
ncbi:hypothetical protein DAI22_02g164100 [Oryza sativa Japonica Group]|jgi:hypothetical protein|nr:hypothetical protein DAI22_02g164100 [Oryza sativa Japonica Group]